MIARRYRVSGHVQGVGFRFFVERRAKELGLTGHVRNHDDGSVEVLAVGSQEMHRELAAHLHRGPRSAEVRGVEEQEAPVQQYVSFEIK